MIKRIFITLSVAGLIWSCGMKMENETLRATVDSLRTELTESEEMAATLNEVGVLIDSIDMNRKVLRTNMVEGTSLTNYHKRLEEINAYVKSSTKKIEELEASVGKLKSNNSQFSAMIKKMKNELEAKRLELVTLNDLVNKYKTENESLIQMVSQKETLISEKDNYIRVKEEELVQAENQIRELQIQSKLTEADLYFAQAAALEEAARRTKFAPRKKKVTQREALEMYKKAFFFGKDEAQEKIEYLENKLS